MLQGAGLAAADYRGERLRDHPQDVTGDPDLLNLTRPDVVLDMHRQYLAAGADIITTNTFTATSIGQADYGLQPLVREMNVRGAQLARQAADEAGGRFVAGSIGPLNVTLSLSPRVEDPAYRALVVRPGLRRVRRAGAGAGRGRRGPAAGRDDLRHAQREGRDRGRPRCGCPPAVVDLGDDRRPERADAVRADGRGVLALGRARRSAGGGVNCSLGAAEMRPHVAELSRLAGTYTACHPNAGLPNAFGGYDQAPEETARLLGEFAAAGMVNVVGGCCGTTPAHIARIAAAVSGLAPRPRCRAPSARTRFSGLEPFEIGADTGFVMIGERTNVTGSKRFRRLIESGDYQGAVEVALEQVRGGANLLDVNMDADLLDSEQAMTTFLNLIATEPEVARIPVMIDSSRWSVLRGRAQVPAGQGRGQLDQPQGRRGALP